MFFHTQRLLLPKHSPALAKLGESQRDKSWMVQVKPKHQYCKRNAYANVSTGPFGAQLRLGIPRLPPEKDQGKGCVE
ncbi:uncharacterized protein Bfra_004236 [Botrytis fragariae]|uniref:Uncharacterized protein n=1 Tax=Botrytis fragariae TaxID=1964551 RepID=A0A8H6EJJ9_9HELO|nr:uncharacterized protein Bfra_004236 [Botrytis fragariae]KAF5874230.1 hypothetical protein Bfra_004236 [Botrytis fragariae]